MTQGRHALGHRGWGRAGILGVCALLGAGIAIAADWVPGADVGFGRAQSVLLAGAALLGLGAFGGASRRARARALVFLAACGVALLLAEGVLRLVARGPLSSIYVADTRVLHRHLPGARKSFQRSPANGGQLVSMRINAQGYRGPELRSGAKRVVVYGDSFIAAEFSQLEATFCSRLGVELERAHAGSCAAARYEVVNAGVVAYGPDQIALRLGDELVRLEPELLLVALLSENDFGDLVRNRLFRLTDGILTPLERGQQELAQGILRPLFEARAKPFLARLWERALERRQASAGGVMPGARWRLDSILEACRREFRRERSGAPALPSDLFWDHYDADLALEPGSPAARYKLGLMEAVLAHIRDTAARYDVPLAFMIIPAAVDVCAQHDVVSIDSERYPAYRATRLSDELAAMAERLQVPALNLFEPFARHDPCGLYFHAGDTHWNDAGQAFAAHLMAEFLSARSMGR